MCEGYQQKIKRAEKLASDLGHEITKIIKNTHVVCSSETKRAVYSLEESAEVLQAKQNASLLVADILHNLRCALDYYAYEQYRENSLSPLKEDKIYFPVCETAEIFESKIGYLDNVSNSFSTKLQSIKPYKDINYYLWLLDKMNNISKHREMVLVVVKAAGVDVGSALTRRFNDIHPGWNVPEISLVLRPTEDNLEIDKTLFIDEPDSSCSSKIQFQFNFNIKETKLDLDASVIDTMDNLVTEVKGVIERLEQV